MIRSGAMAPPDRSRLPDFLGIGTPQSGTTWLFDKLVRHPQIFVPERKEMEFFYWERAEPHKRMLGLSAYTRCYAGAESLTKGDLTPNYSVLPLERVRYVARLMPDAKLILNIRHPVDRTWSATRRVLPRYFGVVPDDPATLIDFLQQQEWIHAFSDYPSIIDRWLSVYPKEALLCIGIGEIEQGAQGVLTRTFRHLGVSTDLDFTDFEVESQVNPNPEMAIPGAVYDYLTSRYAGVLEAMAVRGIAEFE